MMSLRNENGLAGGGDGLRMERGESVPLGSLRFRRGRRRGGGVTARANGSSSSASFETGEGGCMLSLRGCGVDEGDEEDDDDGPA